MLIEVTKYPIRYRLLDGNLVRLEPGSPVDLPDDQARKLLAKAQDRVRVVSISSVVEEGFRVEEAQCAHPVYWESMEGPIMGPASVTHMATEITAAGVKRFWLCITYADSWRWIHEDLLRSRAATLCQ